MLPDTSLPLAECIDLYDHHVADHGPGVPADLTSRLFSPFFTTRAGHAGLGLALARKVVLLHGGRITADNLPEGGFRATVILPRKATFPEKEVTREEPFLE